MFTAVEQNRDALKYALEVLDAVSRFDYTKK